MRAPRGRYALSEARERQRMRMHSCMHGSATLTRARSLARSREMRTSAGRLIYRRYRAHLTRNPQLRISCRQCVPMNSILPDPPHSSSLSSPPPNFLNKIRPEKYGAAHQWLLTRLFALRSLPTRPPRDISSSLSIKCIDIKH